MKPTLARTVRAATNCALLCTLALTIQGCGTRTIYVPHGEPVRLRETIKGVKIWAADAKGAETPGVIDLPEGWYALPAK
jgi:hypothetical protein